MKSHKGRIRQVLGKKKQKNTYDMHKETKTGKITLRLKDGK